MSEMKIIPGPGKSLTYGSDEFGEFGSVFLTDEDNEVPPPLDFDGELVLMPLSQLIDNSSDDSDE